MAFTTPRGHRIGSAGEVASPADVFYLTFLDHAHDFNPSQRPLGRVNVFEAQHRSREPF